MIVIFKTIEYSSIGFSCMYTINRKTNFCEFLIFDNYCTVDLLQWFNITVLSKNGTKLISN